MKYIFIIIFLATGLSNISAQISNQVCEQFHNGTYTYKQSGNENSITINGSKHTEQITGLGTVESKIEWFDACNAVITIRKTSESIKALTKGDKILLSVQSYDKDKKIFGTWLAFKGNDFKVQLTEK